MKNVISHLLSATGGHLGYRSMIAPAAMILLFMSLGSAASAQKFFGGGSGRAAAENSCLFDKKLSGGVAKEGLKMGVKLLKQGIGVNESPLCSLQTVPELLLVTTVYLGEAGLAVAYGIDKVEKALDLKQSLVKEIAALEAALTGHRLADQLVDRTVALSNNLGKATKAIEEELEKREREGYLTPEAKELIFAARKSLHRANYFQVQTLAGVTAVKQRYDVATRAEKASWVFHPEVGITEDFLKKAPGRILQAGKNLGRSISLAKKIDRAGSRLDFKIAKKELRASGKNARKDAARHAEDLSFDALANVAVLAKAAVFAAA
jgi:hypothetical protein